MTLDLGDVGSAYGGGGSTVGYGRIQRKVRDRVRKNRKWGEKDETNNINDSSGNNTNNSGNAGNNNGSTNANNANSSSGGVYGGTNNNSTTFSMSTNDLSTLNNNKKKVNPTLGDALIGGLNFFLGKPKPKLNSASLNKQGVRRNSGGDTGSIEGRHVLKNLKDHYNIIVKF